jgi:uncharacterized protein (DUF1697 family)
MTTYVAMLRGINVSGRNTLSMVDLRALITATGGKDVRTYIQSGNAVFTSRRSPSAVVDSLLAGIEAALGTKVPVLLRTSDELAEIVDANPFISRGEDPKTLHVTFLGAVPLTAAVKVASQKKSDDDEFVVIGRQVYLSCPNGYGRTKLTNTFFEKSLGSEATTRNWATVTELADMSCG